MNTTKLITVHDFEMWTQYRGGRTEINLISKCKTWDTERIGRKKQMALKNRHTGEVHIVTGLLPEVVEFINNLAK